MQCGDTFRLLLAETGSPDQTYVAGTLAASGDLHAGACDCTEISTDTSTSTNSRSIANTAEILHDLCATQSRRVEILHRLRESPLIFFFASCRDAAADESQRVKGETRKISKNR